MANNNLQRHERRDKSKWAVTFIAILLAFVAIAAAFVGIFSDGFTNWDKFKTDEEQQEQTEETANGGAVIGEGESNGVKMMSAKIATADYDEYGISPMAETAYQLSAVLEPSDAYNRAVDWVVAFVNPSSAWATGKTVTDYVTVTPTSDGALTANVECLKAFGEQIKVTVTSRENNEATADCMVDYVKRLTGATVSVNGGSTIVCSTDGTDYTVTLNETYSDGTIESTTTITSAKITLTEEFRSAIESYSSIILKDLVTKELDLSSGFVSDEAFIKSFFSSSDYTPQLKASIFFSNGFKNKALEVAGDHANIVVAYKNAYGDEVYKTDTATLGVKFDTNALKTTVSDISIVGGPIVF